MSFERHLDRPSVDPANAAAAKGLCPVSGLAATTEVLTRDGYRTADRLKPGMDVITRDRGMRRILAVSEDTARSRIVCFHAHALGEDIPDQDLLLPARQAVLVRDWRAQAMFGRHEARVPAAALIDEEFITDAGMAEGAWVQIWLDQPSVLYARGLEVLSAHLFDAQMQPAL